LISNFVAHRELLLSYQTLAEHYFIVVNDSVKSSVI